MWLTVPRRPKEAEKNGSDLEEEVEAEVDDTHSDEGNFWANQAEAA
jgi:hypothetical protein